MDPALLHRFRGVFGQGPSPEGRQNMESGGEDGHADHSRVAVLLMLLRPVSTFRLSHQTREKRVLDVLLRCASQGTCLPRRNTVQYPCRA
jgi:hypothetical protein